MRRVKANADGVTIVEDVISLPRFGVPEILNVTMVTLYVYKTPWPDLRKLRFVHWEPLKDVDFLVNNPLHSYITVQYRLCLGVLVIFMYLVST